MATLSCNGTTQYVEFSTLTGGLDSIAGGAAQTYVSLIKRAAVGAVFHDMFSVANSARTTGYGATKFENSNFTAFDCSRAGSGNDGVAHNSTAIWYMIATTMVTADTPDTTYYYRDHTGNAAWTSTTGSAGSPGVVAAAPGATGFMQHGRWLTSDFFSGLLGVTAAWNVKLSSAQLNELKANDKTSDWWNCSAGRPLHLVEYNVAHASLVDLTGNSTVVAPVASPTLVGADPDRWTFDGTGTVASPASPPAARRFPLGL